MADARETHFEMIQDAFKGELGRRIVHASGSVLPALYLLDLAPWRVVQGLFVMAAVLTIVLEVLRLSVGLDWFIYEHLTREYEQDSIAGYLLYMVSSAVVVLVFEPRIAIPAILMLMIADPISGTLSADELRFVKRPRVLVVMFSLCAVITIPFAHEEPLAVVLGGLGGMLADGVKPSIRGVIIDDNLTIAPLAAIGIWLGIELTGVVI